MSISLHPLLDNNSLLTGDPNFRGGILRCHCRSRPVEVKLASNVAHNHACGCSKCWKPSGALFSIVGVVPKQDLHVVANAHKLMVIDPAAVIQRNACTECGVHLYGRIEQEHPFKGLDFVHVELGDGGGKGWQEPQFAAFVSSIIEQGFDPEKMDEVRGKLKGLGLETYDCLSPALMDLIATFTAKKNGVLKAR
jgi:S-(hydroxymethyl)glutathione synthase